MAFRRFRLKNGVNVVTAPMKGTRAVTILALLPVGSRFESERLSGASHFVEHMLFKGTEKRPTYLDISRALDATGANYNAFTYKDYTGYYIKIDSVHAELAFDLLSDMIFNSRFDEAEVNKEKGVIIEELRMYDDNPHLAIELLADQTMYGSHPLGWNVGGSRESVQSLTRTALVNYYRKYYVPANMVVVVAGNLAPRKLKQYLKYFSKGQVKTAAKQLQSCKRYQQLSNLQLSERVRVKEHKMDQAQIVIGYPGLSFSDQRTYALSVLLTILGGGMSSRLFVEVREKRGLAYMISAGLTQHRDTGIVQIQAGLDPARLAEALKVIGAETEKIKTELVSTRELAEAKDNLIGRLTLALEDSGTQAERLARQFWFWPTMETFAGSCRKLRRVTALEVRHMAQAIFKDDQRRVSAIGPLKRNELIKLLN